MVRLVVTRGAVFTFRLVFVAVATPHLTFIAPWLCRLVDILPCFARKAKGFLLVRLVVARGAVYAFR